MQGCINIPAGVLGKGGVIVVNLTGGRVEDDVLEDGTELDGAENIGLLLGREANALGVTSTLDVEDTLVGPAVLIVTDKSTLGVGREGGLAGSRKTEEDSDVAVLALVGRRVESEDVVLDGHLVEEHSEDTLLHLAGVFGTEDDHLLLSEVDGDRRGRSHTSGESVGREGTGVVDDIVGVEALQLFPRWANQHVAHEEGVVCTSADNADADSVALVPSCVAVDDIDAVPGVEVVDCTLSVDTPDLKGNIVSTRDMWNEVEFDIVKGHVSQAGAKSRGSGRSFSRGRQGAAYAGCRV